MSKEKNLVRKEKRKTERKKSCDCEDKKKDKHKDTKVTVTPPAQLDKEYDMRQKSDTNNTKEDSIQDVKKMDLDALKVVKVFGGRHNSEYVYLLENDIIKKKYSPSNPQHVDHFNREIKILNHLRKYPYVTKLLKVDFKNLIIYQTYCGPRPKKTPENVRKIQKRAMELHRKWGVVRRQGNSTPIYNIFLGNTSIKDGEIYFFDFGGNRWHLEK